MRVERPQVVALAAVVAIGAALPACGGDRGSETRPAAEQSPAADGAPRAKRPASRMRQPDPRGVQAASVSGGDGNVAIEQSGREKGTSVSSSGIATVSFNERRRSRLVWTKRGDGPFYLRGRGVSIFSRSARGTADLPAGAARGLYVNGKDWKLVVRPRRRAADR